MLIAAKVVADGAVAPRWISVHDIHECQPANYSIDGERRVGTHCERYAGALGLRAIVVAEDVDSFAARVNEARSRSAAPDTSGKSGGESQKV